MVGGRGFYVRILNGLGMRTLFCPFSFCTLALRENPFSGSQLLEVKVKMRSWRNRQTRTFKGRVGNRVGSSPTDRTNWAGIHWRLCFCHFSNIPKLIINLLSQNLSGRVEVFGSELRMILGFSLESSLRHLP